MNDLQHHGDREVGDGRLDLAVNVYAGDRPAWLDQALRASLDDVGAYPDPTAAEHAIARHHGVRPEQVLATAGAAEAFTLLARARGWRRPVVVHPQFTEPHAALEAAGHRVTAHVLAEPFTLTPVEDADLVVVGNPTNPTGVLHPRAGIEALHAPGRLVVVDEAFMDCVPGEPESLIGTDALVIRSLTKHWGIPGIRAGYAVGPAEVVAELRAQRTPWSVSTQAIAAMTATASTEARTEATRRAEQIGRWREHLERRLAELGVAHVPSRASFVLARPGAGVHGALRRRGVAVRRADTFPGLGPDWVRIAVRDEATTDTLIDHLRSAMIASPSATAAEQARERLAGLATPAGALGRLGDLGVWVAACQGVVPPRQIENPRLAIFAGDHGVAAHGVSAYPPVVTQAMVGTFATGRAGVSALANAHGVHVRVVDVAVDSDDTTPLKVRRGSGAIHLEDALTAAETQRAMAVGEQVAREELAAGADLLISGDMGIGNTTPAAALVAAALGLPAQEVVGRGTGVDEAGLARKTEVVQAALDRAGDRTADPVDTLTALGSADLAASTAYLLTAARAGVPVLLDGLMAVACALTADRIEPGAAAWFAAGHRSTEPAQSLALEKLGLEPLLDLGLRLGEGSGAVAAVPVVRSAVALLRDVALLAEVLPPDA